MRRRWLGPGLCLLCGLIPPTVVFGGSWIRYGTIWAGGAALRGEPVHVLRPRVELGSLGTGSHRVVPAVVWNFSKGPVQVLGSRPSCACLVTDGLPMTIPPSECRTIEVRVKAGPKPGPLSESVYFLTDSAERPEIRVRFAGRTVSADPIHEEPHR